MRRVTRKVYTDRQVFYFACPTCMMLNGGRTGVIRSKESGES